MKKLLFLLLLSIMAFAQQIGTVTAIRGEVTITRGIALYMAHKNLDIQENDTFFTGKRGSMQITFVDNTVITLGRNTVFKVKEYLHNEVNSTHKASFELYEGFFKTVTGKIGKLAPKEFTIKTKTSTIGVRGTHIVGQSSSTNESIICTQGAIGVKTGEQKEVVAKTFEKVEVKLDPRIEYQVAKPTDVVLQEQVARGIKKSDDPSVARIPKSMVVASIKPQYKEAIKKEGKSDQDILKNPTVATNDTPLKVQKQELEAIEQQNIQKADTNEASNEFKDEQTIQKEVDKIMQKTEQPASEASTENKKLDPKALKNYTPTLNKAYSHRDVGSLMGQF